MDSLCERCKNSEKHVIRKKKNRIATYEADASDAATLAKSTGEVIHSPWWPVLITHDKCLDQSTKCLIVIIKWWKSRQDNLIGRCLVCFISTFHNKDGGCDWVAEGLVAPPTLPHTPFGWAEPPREHNVPSVELPAWTRWSVVVGDALKWPVWFSGL